MDAEEFGLSYARLNLRRNPFGTLSTDDLNSVIIRRADIDDLACKIRGNRTIIQFLGEKGSGKSTHMHALREFFPGSQYIYIGENLPLPRFPRHGRLFIDELQRIPLRLRKRLFSCNELPVVASHTDHAEEIRQADACALTIRFPVIDSNTLGAIIRTRIRHSARDCGLPLPSVPPALIDRLIEEFGNDVRSMLNCLYDYFTKMKEEC